MSRLLHILYRFNCIFQRAAEVIHHLTEIISVEKFLSAPNRKVQSVILDLKDSRVVCMIQALAMVYVRITDPYWRMLESNHITYTELPACLQPMLCKVKALQIHPEMILDESIHFVEHMAPNLESPLYTTSMTMCHPDRSAFLLQCVAMIAKGISDTMTTQLGTIFNSHCVNI